MVMSIRIYSIEYQAPVSPVVWQSLLTLLPGELLQKVEKYRRWQDAYGSLFGKHLLTAALRAEGFPGDLSRLEYSAYGRPFLAGGPDFNISHSGTRVVCILGAQGGVGIDLEEIRDLDIGDFRSQFSGLEWEAICSARQPLRAFYHYWTAKECLSKADGRGLNLPLADLKIEHNTQVQLADRYWNLLPIPHFEGYACHIATEEPIHEPALKEFNVSEIIKMII